MTKAEIIEYLYENNVRADITIEQMAEDLAEQTEPQKSCSTCGYSSQTPSCDTCEGYSNWYALDPCEECVFVKGTRWCDNCNGKPKGLDALPNSRKAEQTENSSEIPNNCEDEPQTEADWKDKMWAEAVIEWLNTKTEPQTETEIAKAIVHKMIDDAVIAEDAYPDLRQQLHDAIEDEPQTDDDKKHCVFCKWVYEPNVCGRCRNMNLFADAIEDESQTERSSE